MVEIAWFLFGDAAGQVRTARWLLLVLTLAAVDRPVLGADTSLNMNTNALTPKTARALARLPLRCIEQEYPNKLQKDFEQMLIERARFYFEKNRNCPAAWEPGGEDFFSPALMEADLMRGALPAEEFRTWFKRFLPDLGQQACLLKPAEVTDRTDPKLVHLDGLNLSRAWCMWGMARSLSKADADRHLLLESAQAHLQASLPYVASGNYEGEHWLATFAVYALSEARD